MKHVNLTLEKGEVLGVVGDNGAGKSTLMKVISGAHAPDSGELRLAGAPVSFSSSRAARQAGIEMICQDLALANHLDVGANIFLGREPLRRLAGVVPVIDDAKVGEEVVGLLGRIESHIPDPETRVLAVSGGQRQAVASARAFHWKARVVITDEPTAALAPMESRNDPPTPWNRPTNQAERDDAKAHPLEVTVRALAGPRQVVGATPMYLNWCRISVSL
ncbi:MAG: ATP-binding cassette domain-containing protein [Acetobacteraceae bacterium]